MLRWLLLVSLGLAEDEAGHPDIKCFLFLAFPEEQKHHSKETPSRLTVLLGWCDACPV